MAAPRSFDDKRARIAAIAESPGSDAAAELRRFLADKNGFIAGDAAKVVAKLELNALVPDLVAAFMRLLTDDPVKNDKTCAGKNRIAEALVALGAMEPDLYRAGLRHVQLEPAFGGSADTAAGLRGLCAQALCELGCRDALLDVAPVLADREAVARLGAANAIGGSGVDAAAGLLHLKALVGDAEPEVVAACYRGLLRIDEARYLPFVASVLERGKEDMAEVAAFALGESRSKEALAVLKRVAERRSGDVLDAVLIAIATSRIDEGAAFLLELVADGPSGRAGSAVTALAILRHDAALVERVRALVEARRDKAISARFAERFGR